MAKIRKFTDLTGQVFDLLTAIKRVPVNSAGTKHKWLCSCKCGRKVSVAPEALRSGKRKSCGCLKSTGYLIGNTYGMLTVDGYAERDSSGRVMVNCRCACGGTKTTAARNLSRPHGLHCGCVKIVLPSLRKPELPQLICKVRSSYESNAKKRGQRYELTDTEFTELITSDCYYCGASPSNTKTLRGVELKWNGIDRKKNAEGYVRSNVVTCCSECNYMKCERDHDEFLDRVRKISSRNSLTEDK